MENGTNGAYTSKSFTAVKRRSGFEIFLEFGADGKYKGVAAIFPPPGAEELYVSEFRARAPEVVRTA